MSKSQLIDFNNYSYNYGSKNGVYIIHGFTNSTYETKDLAYFLSKQGFYTMAKNLPGHGTSVSDCNKCKYIDWIEYVEKDVAEMFSICDNVYVVGVSMGSVLSLHLSSIFPLKAAVFAATVLKFKNFIGPRILTPMLHKIVKTRNKGFSYPKTIRDKLNFLGYKVWPLSALNEMRKLTNIVIKELPMVKVPALIINSSQDKLQHPKNVSLVYNSITSPIKELYSVQDANHNMFVSSPDQKLIFNKISSFFKQKLDKIKR